MSVLTSSVAAPVWDALAKIEVKPAPAGEGHVRSIQIVS